MKNIAMMKTKDIIRIEDNSTYLKSEFTEKFPKLSEKLVDKTLDELSKNNNLFIFPNNVLNSKDLEDSNKIIETINDKLIFSNIIGFIGHGNEKLEIHSRFSSGDNDYFLHYMLQKVLNINLVNLNTNISMEDLHYQLLIYLFPSYLNNAMRKGTFKEYANFNYNDMSIKGAIDIHRHINKNIPFKGEIAYSTRELTKDNSLMQLIRHTIEYIRASTNNGRIILNSSEIIRQNISEVILSTPSYKIGNRKKVISDNRITPVRHAYYVEYRVLQQLCLMILTYRSHGIGGENKNIHGILFDVAWLWEEYINTLLSNDFIHPLNKQKKFGIKIYEETYNHYNRTIFPDFYTKNKEIVVDAKYKKINGNINREDLYQIITYSYILKSKLAGVIYPEKKKKKYDKIGKLSGFNAEIFKLSLQIPQDSSSYNEFVIKIESNEKDFKQQIFSLTQ